MLPSPLSHDDYNKWAARNPMPDRRPRPSHQTMALRWGSWRAALKKAGHDIEVLPDAYYEIMGHAGGVSIDPQGGIEGAHDPRSDGGAGGA